MCILHTRCPTLPNGDYFRRLKNVDSRYRVSGGGLRRGGDVPAQVGFPSFAGCLINNAETIFHLPELRQAYLLMCAATTGLKAGAGMDIPHAHSTAISLASGELAK